MRIGIHGSCIVNNELWFSLSHMNGICRLNLDKGEIQYVTSVPHEDMLSEYLYSDIQVHDNKLILAPFNAHDIVIFDTKNYEIRKIRVTTEKLRRKLDWESGNMFYSTTIVGDNAYFIPYRFPGIARLDLESEEIYYLDDWMDNFFNEYDNARIFFREDIAEGRKEQGFWFVSLYYNAIMKYDTNTDKVFCIKKRDAGLRKGYSCISRSDDRFYLVYSMKSEIHVCDLDFTVMEKVKINNRISQDIPIDFIGSITFENYLFLVPYASNKLVRFNMGDNSICDIKVWYTEYPYYTGFWVYKNELFCYGNYKIDAYDMFDGSYRTIYIETESNKKVIADICSKNNMILNEDSTIGLKNFLGFLCGF